MAGEQHSQVSLQRYTKKQTHRVPRLFHPFLYLTRPAPAPKTKSPHPPARCFSLTTAMGLRAYLSVLAALLLLAAPILPVISKSVEDESVAEMFEGGDLGIVGDDSQEFSDGPFSAAPGVHTVCIFPKNAGKLVPAGEETELLVGVHNEGESALKVLAITANVHLPFDHRMFVQNLTTQEFFNASVPLSAQAAFPYTFAVSKFLQPGSFDLVGTIFYEIDEQPYKSVFYNGTIEVVEVGGFLSIETVFLVTFGIALVVLAISWGNGQIQNSLKKTKKAPKVEVGTRAIDANMDEWLQGTAYTQSQSAKSKKKK